MSAHTSQARSNSIRHPPLGPHWWFAIVAGLYLFLFYAVRLPSLPPNLATGEPPRRVDLLSHSLLIDELIMGWLGESGPSLLDRAPLLFLFLAMWLVVLATGTLCLKAIGPSQRLSRTDRLVFSAGLGWSLWSAYILAVGLAGGLRSRPVYFVPASIVLFAWMFLVGKNLSPRRLAFNPRTLPPRIVLPIVAFSFLALVYILGGLLPPLEFDVREYHLQVPKEWYQAGRIQFLPHNVYGNMPLGAEVFALPAMALLGDWWRGALVGKAVLSSFALLAALSIFSAARRFLGTRAGWLGAALFLTIPWVSLVSLNGLIEVVWGGYGSLALYALAIDASSPESERGKRQLPILSGWLAGAAAACKYPALLYFVLPLSIAWLVFGFVRARKKHAPPSSGTLTIVQLAGRFLLFALASSAVGGGWYVKNIALTGNPFYPLLNTVFASRSRTPETDQRWNDAHRPPGFSLSDLGDQVSLVLCRSEWLSPALVPSLIASIACAFISLCRKTERLRGNGAEQEVDENIVVVFAALVLLWGFLSWWFLTHRIDRFLVPFMPAAAWVASAVMAKPRFRIPLIVLLAIAGTYWFIVTCGGIVADPRFLAPLAELRYDENRFDPWHRYLNEHVPLGKKALLVGDAQVFDLEIPILYNTVFDELILERLCDGKTPEDCHRALREAGISHVYVHWGEIRRYRSPGNYGFSSFPIQEWIDALIELGKLDGIQPRDDHPGRVYQLRDGSIN